MAISNYTELQAAISDWMARSDITATVPDCITLGEARLNRMLGPVSTSAVLAATVGVNTISISALSPTMIKPTSLFLTDVEEYAINPQPNGTFSILTDNGFPRAWAIQGTNIIFDRPCDQAYAARFVYQGRFALSDAAPTNEFLTNHPDLYMAAAIVWGNVYVKDMPAASMWQQMLADFEAQVKSENAQKKRGTLTVDNALQVRGENTRYWASLP
jgi:hypothetical protein